MGGTLNKGIPKKGFSKNVIAILIGMTIIIGGSVLAYEYFAGSPKIKYLKAEKNTLDFAADTLTDRYQMEAEWQEQTNNNPVKNKLELSAEYHNPDFDTDNMFVNPQQLMNNSAITIISELDRQKQQLAASAAADLGGIKIGEAAFYLDADKGVMELPFLKQSLQMQDKDLGKFLHEINPKSFSGNQEFDFADFFDSLNGYIIEKDIDHIKKAYGKLIFKKLPDKAFTAANETITVDSQKLDTEKLTLHLNENQLKDILQSVLEKLNNDKQIKQLIKKQAELQSFGIPVLEMENTLHQIRTDLDASIKEAEQFIHTIQIPNGLTSVIWIHDGLIVKRDFRIDAGPNQNKQITVAVNGTQLLTGTNQTFDYELAAGSSSDLNRLTIHGNLTSKNNKAEDLLAIKSAGFSFTYNGTETQKDESRSFERTLSLQNHSETIGSLIWSGQTAYQHDRMKGEHTIAVNTPAASRDLFRVHLTTEGQLIKQVHMPDQSNLLDIGAMNQDELKQYMRLDVQPQFQRWLLGMMGSSSLGF